MNRLIRIPLALAVLYPLLSGYTSCNQWDTTVVPDTDTRPPIAIAGYVNDRGKHIWNLGPVDVYTTDPNDQIIAVSSAWDAGGAREVSVGRDVTLYCRKGSLGQLTSFDYITQRASQNGGPGDTVSEGVYTYHIFNVADYHCAPGFEATKIVDSWVVVAEDFFGNQDYQGGNTITWTKN